MDWHSMNSYELSNRDLLSGTKVEEPQKVNDTQQVNTANIIPVSSSNSTSILQGFGLLIVIMVAFGFYGN